MKKTFFKNLFRDVKNTPSRFLSIVIIIAVGVAFYSGVRATSPAMKASADRYFDENNFMDFKLISTLGLTEDDKDAIVKQKGITRVEGAYSLDGVIEKDDKQLVLNINSLPDKNGINDIRITQGRRAEKSDEIVVEEHFLEESKLKLNDYIVLKSGTEGDIKDDLNQTRFKVVGTAISPLYLSGQRQISSVGNGNVRGFVYVLSEVFESEVYTEIYARAENSVSEASIINNEDYNKYTKPIKKDLEEVGLVRNDIRYEEVYTEANEKLLDAERELNNSKREAQEEIADGYRELNKAQKKINDGKRELKANENIFNQKMIEGKNELEKGKKEIENAEKEIPFKRQEIEAGKKQIQEGKKKLEASQAQLNAGKQQAASQVITAVGAEVKKAEELMNSDAETNIIKFLGKISPIHFLYSIVLTVLFSAIVNLAMYKRFSKIDMIESLKSAE